MAFPSVSASDPAAAAAASRAAADSSQKTSEMMGAGRAAAAVTRAGSEVVAPPPPPPPEAPVPSATAKPERQALPLPSPKNIEVNARTAAQEASAKDQLFLDGGSVDPSDQKAFRDFTHVEVGRFERLANLAGYRDSMPATFASGEPDQKFGKECRDTLHDMLLENGIDPSAALSELRKTQPKATLVDVLENAYLRGELKGKDGKPIAQTEAPAEPRSVALTEEMPSTEQPAATLQLLSDPRGERSSRFQLKVSSYAEAVGFYQTLSASAPDALDQTKLAEMKAMIENSKEWTSGDNARFNALLLAVFKQPAAS